MNWSGGSARGTDGMPPFLLLRFVSRALVVAASFTKLHESVTEAAERPSPMTGALQALITTSELVVGQNRFAFGLLKHHKLLDDAHVVVRVYDIRDHEAQFTAETRARYHELEVFEQGNNIPTNPDGTRPTHGGPTDGQGTYVAQGPFDRPAPWALEPVPQQVS